jgi:hypothetical protein
MMKSMSMRWVEHAAGVGEIRNARKILVVKGRDHSEDTGIDVMVILEWVIAVVLS